MSKKVVNKFINNYMNNYGGGGIGFTGLLFLTFLTLKLTGIITWSWIWITAPLWGPIGILLGIVVALFVCTFSLAGFIMTGYWLNRLRLKYQIHKLSRKIKKEKDGQEKK